MRQQVVGYHILKVSQGALKVCIDYKNAISDGRSTVVYRWVGLDWTGGVKNRGPLR